jgi:hypothetical protein
MKHHLMLLPNRPKLILNLIENFFIQNKSTIQQKVVGSGQLLPHDLIVGSEEVVELVYDISE